MVEMKRFILVTSLICVVWQVKHEFPLELFEDDVGEQPKIYGPANYGLDRRTRQDLKNFLSHSGELNRDSENSNQRPFARGDDSESSAKMARLQSEIGESAAAKLTDPRTDAALKEYRYYALQTANALRWHRRRHPSREGSREAQPYWARTPKYEWRQTAAHRFDSQSTTSSSQAATSSAQPIHAYTPPRPANPPVAAAFSYPEHSAQSTPIISPPPPPPAPAMASRVMSKVEVAAGLGRPTARQLKALLRVTRRAQMQLRTARHEARAALQRERRERATELAAAAARDAAWHKAEAARVAALKLSKLLLGQKRHVGILRARAKYDDREAAELTTAATRLEVRHRRRQAALMRLDRPIQRAEKDVDTANRAYNAAVMRLAEAESAAGTLPPGTDPAREKEALDRIEKFRLESRKMEDLVEEATARLNHLETQRGPDGNLRAVAVTTKGSTKRLAEARLARAAAERQRSSQLLRQAHKEAVAVRGQIPTLKAAIRKAKRRHDRFALLVARDRRIEKHEAKYAARESAARQHERRAREVLDAVDRRVVALQAARAAPS